MLNKDQKSYPPPVVRPRFRVILFVGPCSALVVVGEDVSDVCFRFSEALDIEGVVFGPEGPGAADGVDVDAGADVGVGPCWDTDLFCFCGDVSTD